MYEDADDPEAVVEETHHELRIDAFEQAMNQGARKVRVPRDIVTTSDVVDRVVADTTFAPFLSEWTDSAPIDEPDPFADAFPEFDHKRGTYWRWLRCVIGGDPVEGAGDDRSLRIEYRPLPTQPTVTDIISLQCLVGGLLRGLVTADHPLTRLPWDAAEESFYNAVEEGLRANLQWITADGERTDASGVIFEEIFEYAHRGLVEQGIPEEKATEYLAPIRARWETGMTPSEWKRERVRERMATEATLPEAIAEMQRVYVQLSSTTDSFAQWP
jgi:hypothetical protein